MDSLIGVSGKGFVIVAADMSAARSIMAYQYSDHKVRAGGRTLRRGGVSRRQALTARQAAQHGPPRAGADLATG